MTINEKIAALRAEMQQQGVAAVIVPSNDPHQSEYIATRFACREWISGFTGSAGTAVVTLDHAGVWTDSRYEIQAEEELADSEFVQHQLKVQGAPEFIDYLAENLPAGSVVGIDGQLFSLQVYHLLEQKLGNKNIAIKADFDPFEKIWTDRPAMPGSAFYNHPIALAGVSTEEKLEKIRAEMQSKQADALMIEALDEIAWVLNIRGADVDCNPVGYAYLTVESAAATLFVDPAKIGVEVAAALQTAGVAVEPYEEVEKWLAEGEFTNIQVDPARFSIHQYELLAEGKVVAAEASPVQFMKAVKNEAELAGMRSAMKKDGVALVKFYKWVEEEAAKEGLSEAQCAEKLKEFRAEQEGYVGESFSAIVGFQGNGAIVHYRPQDPKAKKLNGEGMLLIDSGGQYKDGTTDITRTFYLGTPSAEHKKAYTLVLKGHIAIEQVVFPAGYAGPQIDVLARQPLWAEGMNYGHGTGHGVGASLNVHEGPINFGNKGVTGGTPFQVGMIISDEPGFYKTDAYGIRLENLVTVVEKYNNEFGQFLAFESLTLAPFEPKLIEADLLSVAEKEWLVQYQQEVRAELLPLLSEEEGQWLEQKCISF
ncbi:aminopeptidase P family protein [Persicobacter sp. CCB-QB2]|uniref:aminopeptidase P family protein n=1 Tax=Persicobacter sp. CCB-QB2 TaxID=1561025 RepID=UPI0006A956E4|nr:aminopeptidase P family protein [Persicobacter sp. CCB-QB2]